MHLVPSVPLVHCVIHLTSGEYLLCARHSGVCIVRQVHSAAEVKTWCETETETEGAGGSIPEEWWRVKPLMPPSVGFQSNMTITLKANPVMVIQSEVEIKRQDFEIFRIGLLG